MKDRKGSEKKERQYRKTKYRKKEQKTEWQISLLKSFRIMKDE